MKINVASLSGGKDSTAMVIMAKEKGLHRALIGQGSMKSLTVFLVGVVRSAIKKNWLY